MVKKNPYPSAVEAHRLKEIIKAWDPALWQEWAKAIEDIFNVYTPKQTITEVEAREKLNYIQSKVMLYLVNQGLADRNTKAIPKVDCIQELLRHEMGMQILPQFRYLIDET